ncbi:MAG: MerR family transcriptional regulator [Lachnospiraceae bacterium]|mgnify:CR=1 FL=1|nr:MerR family transcriptional regulator [Lachnospiraceae bacterium]
MSQYLSIGKVSKLKNVSIKSLRYYDQIGILKPAFVNTETNYRYYTKEQLYLLDAITVCIKLGIPLKDLNNYVENSSINLQKLLYDGKILAEQKIMDIHNCLATLQETLQNMASSVTGLAKIPESKSGILLPDGFYHNEIVTRRMLTVPLEEMDVPKYYGQYILKLFVTAQQMGTVVAYPSGVLHEYRNGQYQRHMFLTITDDTPASEDAAQNIRTINEGSFACRRISTHVSDFETIREEMKEVIKSDDFCVIETDTLSEENKKNGYPFELEYPLSS